MVKELGTQCDKGRSTVTLSDVTLDFSGSSFHCYGHWMVFLPSVLTFCSREKCGLHKIQNILHILYIHQLSYTKKLMK